MKMAYIPQAAIIVRKTTVSQSLLLGVYQFLLACDREQQISDKISILLRATQWIVYLTVVGGENIHDVEYEFQTANNIDKLQFHDHCHTHNAR